MPQTLAAGDLAGFAKVCTTIANEAADARGFVSVRSLLARFRTKLILRPLLIEGMLASDPSSSNASGRSNWAVLIDSETFPLHPKEIDEESAEHPLPSRFRNTVAHELVHALAFRSTEFGVRLRTQPKDEDDMRVLVRAIENETERLSPLLLWPEKAIRELVRTKAQAVTIRELARICRTMGISRYVLVSRLRLLRAAEYGYLDHVALKNIAVGIGEWVGAGKAVLKGWPTFINFERNIVPEPILRLIQMEQLPADAEVADQSFVLCGGSNGSTEMDVPAGVPAVPKAESMKIQFSAEDTSRKPGSTFLFSMAKAS